jgi:hypothetical protein
MEPLSVDKNYFSGRGAQINPANELLEKSFRNKMAK